MKTQFTIALLVVLSAGAFAQRPAARRPGGAPPVARVTGVHLNVAPVFRNYQGACPVRVTFQGNISTNGPATVPYTFEASDGHGYTTHQLVFPRAGTKPVNEVWRVDRDFSGWIALRPEAPFNHMSSTRAFFRVKCTGHLRGD